MKDCLHEAILPGVITTIYTEAYGMQPAVVTKVGNAMVNYTLLKVEESGSGLNYLNILKFKDQRIERTAGSSKIAVVPDAEKRWTFSSELNEMLFELEGGK